MDAENTHQVFDWLWSSGQLSERDILALPALGIEAVINLALPTSSNALPGEAELITRQGIAYVQIPVIWENRSSISCSNSSARCMRSQDAKSGSIAPRTCASRLSFTSTAAWYSTKHRISPHTRCAKCGCPIQLGRPSS